MVLLYMIPFNLVSVEVKVKTCAVAYIYGGILRLVCIIYNAVFAVFNISVNLNIIVSGIPTVKFILGTCAPKNRTVENTAVLK